MAPTTFQMGRTAAKVEFEANHHILANINAAQKIKSTLIHKAKVKKSYAKLKEREQLDSGPAYDPYTTTEDAPNPEEPKSPTLEIHPERQAMLDNPLPSPPPPSAFQGNATESRPRKAPKFRPFVKESEHARNKREVAEVRREAIEESNRQRNEKLADRERMRRMTATARKPDRNGQRRLGRESKVLLERVKRLVGK